ncbi:hypothetical protein [Prosthecobacter sp.]|uniref:hypothetical protein n=1 Tax=Prosthecobacter sp. TaxID=1965333 RepID=UPI003783F4C7
MKRFLSLRFFAKLVAGLVVLCVIGVGVENWTGARALAEAREDFMAKGGVLEFAAMQAKPLPTETNFLAIEQLDGISVPREEEELPIHRKLLALDWAYAAIDKNPKAPRPNLNGGSATSVPLDVQGTAAYLSETSYIDTAPDADAAQVLAAIDRLHPLLKELSDAAVDRREACFDHSASLGYVRAPYKLATLHLNGALRAAKGLELRAQMAAAAGDAESAVRSVQASMRFTQALCQEPLLIGLLSGTATADFDVNSLWYLLSQHTASAEQLARLQADLERLDLMRAQFQAMRGELVWQMESIEWYKGHRDDFLKVFSEMQFIKEQTEPAWHVSAALHMIPSGWFDHNGATALRLGSVYLIEPAMSRDGRGMMRAFDEIYDLLKKNHGMASPHHAWSVLGFSSFRMIIQQAIYCEALRRQCLAAIAIERYRLMHGKLPVALSNVVPEFLAKVPQDIMDDAPMRYRAEGDGKFALWSIGWDGKDDGGIRPEGKEAKRANKANYVGDWVWKN